MTWLLMLILLSAIFSLGLTVRYNDRYIEAKAETVRIERECVKEKMKLHEETYRIILEANTKISMLEDQNKLLRGAY